MSKPKKTKKLDQEIVAQAISKLKIKPLAEHLAEVGLDIDIAAGLLQHLRLANGLVLRQADVKKAARRNAFLNGVTEILRAEFGDEVDEVTRVGPAPNSSEWICCGRTPQAARPSLSSSMKVWGPQR